MESTLVLRSTLTDPIHGEVKFLELRSTRGGPLPLCLFLHGGGGSSESLLALQPVFERAWASGALPPCRVAAADVDPWGFYLDDPARGTAWETLVAERLVDRLAPEGPVVLLGVSMGGYGALKIAFARPARFRAVVALEPMVEPAFAPSEVRPRNRFFYPKEVPPALLGPERDARLYVADHPAHRARANAEAIRTHDLAVYLDAAGRDALNAHDGAELLHRVLWSLDIVHEYRLIRDADHVGPSLVRRVEAALAWIGGALAPSGDTAEADALRASLQAARTEAARQDPTVVRHYGFIPQWDEGRL